MSRNQGSTSNGDGNIRKITIKRNGKEYTYWQGRYSLGLDPGTGKQIQKSFSCSTKKEAVEKLKELTLSIDQGNYHEPTKATLKEWASIWTKDYLIDTKPRTADSYRSVVENHLIPNLGAVKLTDLTFQMIQSFINDLSKGSRARQPLSAKTIKNIHGVLHACLQQALKMGLIDKNPAYGVKLPRREKPELFTFSEEQTKSFIQACQTNKFGPLYLVILFTGMREGEALGLTWKCVNFKTGILTIKGQLQRTRDGTGNHYLVSTKNGKTRYITVAPYVLETLRKVKTEQDKWKCDAQGLWENSQGFVFTNELGHPLSSQTAYLYYKRIVSDLGYPSARVHDLRHTFATMSLQNGVNIKIVQEQLGHYSAAFTMDVYAYATVKAQTESATLLQNVIKTMI